MTSLLILGAQGQIGRAIVARARDVGVAHEPLGRAECDIADPLAVEHAVRRSSFAVNCAAYTSVDRAETEPAAANRINALGAKTVAAACAAAGVPLVHLSTDYVFDGLSDRPAREDDPARPLNVYGQSKLAGEIAVRELQDRHVILRTSWVFRRTARTSSRPSCGSHPHTRNCASSTSRSVDRLQRMMSQKRSCGSSTSVRGLASPIGGPITSVERRQ
jgi:dTDP-4-dehydrorhamnose reductase